MDLKGMNSIRSIKWRRFENEPQNPEAIEKDPPPSLLPPSGGQGRAWPDQVAQGHALR
jgi:hypothetical protein